MAPSGRAAEVEVRAVSVSEATGAEDKPVGAWGIGGWALVATAFVVGFVNFPMQVVGWTFECLPGDGIDNRLNNFVLEHGYRYLCGRADSFWDAPAFYPALRITASSDALLTGKASQAEMSSKSKPCVRPRISASRA